jgi:hypothetical protein
MLKHTSLILTAAALSACSSMPDVTYHYYQAKSATAMSVTQNLQCIKNPKTGKKEPKYLRLDITTSIPAPLTTYSADYTQPAKPLRVRDLDGSFSDTDANFTFTEDGRLASMNATLTGEGETILKSAISLGTTAASFAGVLGVASHDRSQPKAPSEDEVCQMLSGWPGADKLALTFTRVQDFSGPAKDWTAWQEAKAKADAEHKPEPFPQQDIYLNDNPDIAITVSDQKLYDYLKASQVSLPSVTVKVGNVSPNVRVATYDPTTSGDVATLDLQDTSSVRLDYIVEDPKTNARSVGTSSNVVVVPLKGSIYQVALPKGAAFGNGKVALTLSLSGAITNLEYSKTNGSAGPMNVAAAALTAATPAATTPTPPPASPADHGPNVTAGGGNGPNPNP